MDESLEIERADVGRSSVELDGRRPESYVVGQ